MNTTMNIWGTKVGQDSISETVALYIAFSHEAVAQVQGIAAADVKVATDGDNDWSDWAELTA